jgi:hypothetical protein
MNPKKAKGLARHQPTYDERSNPGEKESFPKKMASVGKKLYGLPNVRGLHGWVGFVASHAWDDALIRAHTAWFVGAAPDFNIVEPDLLPTSGHSPLRSSRRQQCECGCGCAVTSGDSSLRLHGD